MKKKMPNSLSRDKSPSSPYVLCLNSLMREDLKFADSFAEESVESEEARQRVLEKAEGLFAGATRFGVRVEKDIGKFMAQLLSCGKCHSKTAFVLSEVLDCSKELLRQLANLTSAKEKINENNLMLNYVKLTKKCSMQDSLIEELRTEVKDLKAVVDVQRQRLEKMKELEV
jgi:hypothetical protein